MTRNLGTTDRLLRLVVAVVALLLAVPAEGGVAVALFVLAAAMIATSAVGWCPLYVPFGITTCRARRT